MVKLITLTLNSFLEQEIVVDIVILSAFWLRYLAISKQTDAVGYLI